MYCIPNNQYIELSSLKFFFYVLFWLLMRDPSMLEVQGVKLNRAKRNEEWKKQVFKTFVIILKS